MSKIYAFDTLESTNTTAKEMALAGAGHGTVVTAERQMSGRGRHGRDFFSPAGDGIYMSMVLQPARLDLETPVFTTIFTAVRVCQAVEAVCGKMPGIKWVNDIFLDGKKICGILAETVSSAGIQWVAAGIGVNYSTSEFPEELHKIAGAVFPDGKPPVPKERLIEEIARRMLLPQPTDEILREYRKRLCMLGKQIWVCAPEGRYAARALDIDAQGRLLVEKEDGQVESLFSGEISVKLP